MLTNQEFADLLADPTKEIVGDIRWAPSDTHRWVREFAVDVESATGWPLWIKAWWNPVRSKLSYTLILDGPGRIVGLDLGTDVGHHNPGCRATRAEKRRCNCPRGLHKQRWTEEHEAKQAYVPLDITAEWDDPVGVWRQFCAEINVTHRGILWEPEGAEPW